MSQSLELGVVRWFDKRSGEGFIRTTDGESIFVHYSAIDVGHDIHSKDVWRILFSGQRVAISVIRDSHWTQVSYVGDINLLDKVG